MPEFLRKILGEILTCFWIGDGKKADTERALAILLGFMTLFYLLAMIIYQVCR